MKTVELIVDEDDWHPNPSRIPPNKRVALKVEYGERALGQRIRAAGGHWNRSKRVWELAYKEVVALGLSDRMVGNDAETET